jgi:glycosyltransferase involved in cell wall biosynthesis
LSSSRRRIGEIRYEIASKDGPGVESVSSDRVSVVITCYNYARFLPDAVESVLGQTFRDLEVILVDDGSTDDTPQVVMRWGDEPRFRYVRQENAGQAAAKNLGIRLAREPLVAFLDADDRWDLSKLAKQVPLFARAEVGVVYSRGLYLDAAGTTRIPGDPGRERAPRAGTITEFLLYDNMIPFSSAVVRRNLLQEVGGFDEQFAMAIDWDLWLRLSRLCEFAWVDEPLLHYRIGHGDQMSRQALVRLECCERILDRFLDQHGAELPRSRVRAALAYSYAQRGSIYEVDCRRKALGYYGRSIAMRPTGRAAWFGLVRTALQYLRASRP